MFLTELQWFYICLIVFKGDVTCNILDIELWSEGLTEHPDVVASPVQSEETKCSHIFLNLSVGERLNINFMYLI